MAGRKGGRDLRAFALTAIFVLAVLVVTTGCQGDQPQ